MKYVDGLNSNNIYIKLDRHWSKEQVNYLNVSVMLKNNLLITKVYFKPTDRNSYLPIHSGHHPLWLKNISKGPSDADFESQTQVIKKKHMEKGYKAPHLDRVFEEVDQITQEIYLIDKGKQDDGKRE